MSLCITQILNVLCVKHVVMPVFSVAGSGTGGEGLHINIWAQQGLPVWYICKTCCLYFETCSYLEQSLSLHPLWSAL